MSGMSGLPDRPDPSQMRISDADRARAAEHIRLAAGEGRLDINEVDARLRAVYAATTFGELATINADLPAPVRYAAPAGAALDEHGDRVPDSGIAVGIMGGFARRGTWRVPRRFKAIAFWGGGTLDLRQARFTAPVTTIKAYAVMGGMQIVVPENADVETTGVGIMGGFGHAAERDEDHYHGDQGHGGQVHDGQAHGGPRPRIRIGGFAFWGGVDIRRRG